MRSHTAESETLFRRRCLNGDRLHSSRSGDASKPTLCSIRVAAGRRWQFRPPVRCSLDAAATIAFAHSGVACTFTAARRPGRHQRLRRIAAFALRYRGGHHRFRKTSTNGSHERRTGGRSASPDPGGVGPVLRQARDRRSRDRPEGHDFLRDASAAPRLSRPPRP
jgi:hypothetical protein